MQQVEHSSYVWLPFDSLGRKAQAVIDELTTVIENRDYSAPTGETRMLEPTIINNYEIDEEREAIGVPIFYGKQFAKKHGLKLRRVSRCSSLCAETEPCTVGDKCQHAVSYPKRPDPHHPKAPKGQAEVFKESLAILRSEGNLLLCVKTGGGKTATALNHIAELGVSALIVVPRKELARQWRDEAKAHVGLTDSQIGIVEESTVDYEGKHITVAVVHNLVQKAFTEEFYSYFGAIVYDECHNLGAESFSKSLKRFNVDYRIGASATPKRKDKADRVFTQWLGEPVCFDNVEITDCEVYRLPIENNNQLRGRNLAQMLSCMALLKPRNRILAQVIANFYFEPGTPRHILAISDRTEQLSEIAKMLEQDFGISKDSIGVFARKVMGKAESKALLEKRVVLATYGMAKEGVNIPVWSVGIDLTPRSDANQVVGRIRRVHPTKPNAIWITPVDARDRASGKILGFIAKKRIDDYLAAGCHFRGDYTSNIEQVHTQK